VDVSQTLKRGQNIGVEATKILSVRDRSFKLSDSWFLFWYARRSAARSTKTARLSLGTRALYAKQCPPPPVTRLWTEIRDGIARRLWLSPQRRAVLREERGDSEKYPEAEAKNRLSSSEIHLLEPIFEALGVRFPPRFV